MPDAPKIQSSQNTAVPQPRVFSMPEKYRHGAVASVVEPQKVVAAPAPVVVPPTPPKPVAPLPAAVLQKPETHGKQVSKGLLIAGGVVLVSLGVAGYLLLRSTQQNPAKIAETPTAPASTTETPTTPAAPTTSTTTTETPVTPTTPFPITTTPGVDSDSDGLTDTEETLVYSTDARLPDSDGDGFLDGNEVFHGYNPNGTAPGTLLLAGLVSPLTIENFSFVYPAKWSVLPGQEGGDIVSSTTGEIVTVKTSMKDPALSLADWNTQNAKEEGVSTTKTKRGFPMLISKNQLKAYVDLGDTVVTLVYDIDGKTTVDYLQTFQMMINSIELNK